MWENSQENNYPMLVWDLEGGVARQGAYQGEEGYEKLFESSPAPMKLPLPTIAPRETPRTPLPIDPRPILYLASWRQITVYDNQAIAGVTIQKDLKLEDFYCEAGLADNPVEGLLTIGWLSTSCDASRQLRGLQKPLLSCYRQGIPAEAITIKDLDNGKEQLKQVLIGLS